jgi:hypothetical protein
MSAVTESHMHVSGFCFVLVGTETRTGTSLEMLGGIKRGCYFNVPCTRNDGECSSRENTSLPTREAAQQKCAGKLNMFRERFRLAQRATSQHFP